MLAFAPHPFREARTRPTASAPHRKDHRVRRRSLNTELQEVVRLGFASSPEEVAPGLNAVAAPRSMRRTTASRRLSFRFVDLNFSLPEKPRPSDVVQLIEAARQISRKLGHARSADLPTLSKRNPRAMPLRQHP